MTRSFIGLLLLAATCSALRISTIITRRTVLQATPIAFAPLVAHADEDPLVTRLGEVRARLEVAQSQLESGEMEKVRLAVKAAVTPLTMKGYLGVSVKSRAQESGSVELAAARTTLLRSLGAVDQYCYKRQTSFGQSLELDESAKAATSLSDSIQTIDAVIKML